LEVTKEIKQEQALKVKKYFSIITLTMMFILFFTTTTSFAKVDIGGELNITLSGVLFREGEALAYPQGSLDLELYIPPFDNNQVKSAAYLYTNPTTGQLDFMFKKLYLGINLTNCSLLWDVSRYPGLSVRCLTRLILL
jgi:hypothetical protein